MEVNEQMNECDHSLVARHKQPTWQPAGGAELVHYNSHRPNSIQCCPMFHRTTYYAMAPNMMENHEVICSQGRETACIAQKCMSGKAFDGIKVL